MEGTGEGKNRGGVQRKGGWEGLVKSKEMMSTCCPRYIAARDYFRPLVYLLCLLVKTWV